MKSLYKLPSKEFVEFLNSVQEYQQTSRLTCTFWWKMVACYCRVTVMPNSIQAKITTINPNDEIGDGIGGEVTLVFIRYDNTPKEKDLH